MVQKVVTYKATMHKLKLVCFFSQWTLLFNNLAYLGGVLLRIMGFLVMARSAENIEEKKKTDRRKTLKSEEKEKRRIRGESNSNNIHL